MRISEIIHESLADWGPDWIHFTDHPMLTIHPKQSHRDPAGIYFFPAQVNPDAEMWRVKPYKFTVQIKPGARILDVSQITSEQIYQMIDAAGPQPREQFDAYIAQYPPKDVKKMFDMAWERLQAHYSYEGGKTRQYASFNAMLRSLGWQAIFDDTGGIHTSEKQLLVLDPRIITNVRMEQKSGTGFAAMQKVVQEVAALGKQFGAVEVGQPQKPSRTSYSENDNLLICPIMVSNPQDEKNYCRFMVRIRKQYPDRISVSVQYTNPSLGYGSGAEYSISKGTYISHGGLDVLQRDLTKIFAPQQQVAPQPQQAVAELKKVAGPRLVGSGKDFRQQAGTNRSPKQPGNLVGSGKALKVKPGFVGG